MLRRQDRALWALVAILLLAAGLRLAGQELSPPGLSHDEVANWLIDRRILGGEHAVYFEAAYGHEAGFHYLQAASIALLGDHALALRLPAMFAGVLLVAVTYALNRRLFGPRPALMAAAFLAVLFWPVFLSRQGLRAITLPVVAGLSALAWWRAWHTDRRRWWLAAGGLAGLSLYTYMAARAVPIIYTVLFFYLYILYFRERRRLLPKMLVFFAAMALIAAPLIWYLMANPGAEFRVGEIDAPLRALGEGDPMPAIKNAFSVLGMFAFRGDPLWRQNVAGMPVYDPVIGSLFYGGLLLSIWRWRDPRHVFALLWLSLSAIPSIVTIDAPSFIRICNSLPVVTAFPALAIHRLGSFSTVFPKLSTEAARKRLIWGFFLLLLAWQIGRTTDALFSRWPANEEVRFVWQAALTDMAEALDASPVAGSVAVGGWTPETMDVPTMALSLRRTDLRIVHFQPERTLILPAGAPIRLLHPTILPPSPALLARLAAWDAAVWEEESFMQVTLDKLPRPRPEESLNVAFGGELRLLGVDRPWVEGGGRALISYWEVLAPASGPRRLFLHAVDEGEALLAQDDGLGVPADQWQRGDLILFYHRLPPVETPPAALRLGVFAPPDGPRLLTAEDREFVTLEP
jgi:4-amino-4-deoxy-L-arabinose transferase-like glycosyltransferase